MQKILLLLTPVLLGIAPPVPAQGGGAESGVAAILARARLALAGDSAAEGVLLRVTYLGRQDLTVVQQGFRWDQADPRRYQESLVLDAKGHRAALRTEGSWSDGSPDVWRTSILADSGFRTNLKTAHVTRISGAALEAAWRGMAWRVPALIVAELSAAGDRVRSGPPISIEGRPQLTLNYQPAWASAPVVIQLDRKTGLLTGYGHPVATLQGPGEYRVLFGEYRHRPGIGAFPDRLRLLVAQQPAVDLRVIDARVSPGGEDPWLTGPPPGSAPVSRIAAQPTRADSVAPGVWVLRNVGGYNALAVDLGRCFAIVDAPARFAVGPLPADSPPDLGQGILDLLATVRPSATVCYVVPTHHHSDHFGGIVAPARAGASVVTSPGNVELVRRVLTAGRVPIRGTGGRPAILPVERRLVLGSGDGRLEIHLLRNDPHVAEMLFAYLPAARLVFQGDIDDYVLSARNFLRAIDDLGLSVDRIYGTHNSRYAVPADLLSDEPGN